MRWHNFDPDIISISWSHGENISLVSVFITTPHVISLSLMTVANKNSKWGTSNSNTGSNEFGLNKKVEFV
jgi:hypothetical protein